MKNVLVRLKEYSSQANGAEKFLIRFILEHPEDAVKLSVHALAAQTYTSAATIIRLCRKLGFEGYKEMIACLNYENALRSSQGRDISTEIDQRDSLKDVVDKVTYRSIQALEDTRKLVDIDELENCVKILVEANTIGLFGIGSSLLAARDMYLKFLRLNKSCICNDDLHSQIVCAANLKFSDAAVIFSYSGLTKEMVELADILNQKEVPLITVTRFGENLLTSRADHRLYVSAKELLVRTAATASRISQLNIIDILFTAYVKNDYDNYLKQLKSNIIGKEQATNKGGTL